MIFDKLKNLKRRELTALWIAVVCVALFIVDRLAVQPLWRAIRDLDRSIETEQTDLSANLGILHHADKVERSYAEVRDVMEVAASPEATVDAMKARIDAMASKCRLTIGSMEERRREVAEIRPYRTYVVEIGSFEAALPDLLQFLHGIGAESGLMRVARLTFESITEEQRLRGSIQIAKDVVHVAGS